MARPAGAAAAADGEGGPDDRDLVQRVSPAGAAAAAADGEGGPDDRDLVQRVSPAGAAAAAAAAAGDGRRSGRPGGPSRGPLYARASASHRSAPVHMRATALRPPCRCLARQASSCSTPCTRGRSAAAPGQAHPALDHHLDRPRPRLSRALKLFLARRGPRPACRRRFRAAHPPGQRLGRIASAVAACAGKLPPARVHEPPAPIA